MISVYQIGLKSHMEFFLTSSLNWWWVCSDSCGINLLMYAIMLKKSWLDFRKSMHLIALIFHESGEIPFPDISCPKNIILVAPKTHVFLINFKPDFWILLRLAQCKCLIDFGRMPICWNSFGYSLPTQNTILFPQCHVGKL